jgi:hypothetical protein
MSGVGLSIAPALVTLNADGSRAGVIGSSTSFFAVARIGTPSNSIRLRLPARRISNLKRISRPSGSDENDGLPQFELKQALDGGANRQDSGERTRARKSCEA